MAKAVVTLAGVPLAGNDAVTWRWQTGTQPYRTVVAVHKDEWGKLESRMGQPLTLRIRDHRDREVSIEQVYILHTTPTSSEARVSFVIADKRWKWPYKLIARDYNRPKKSGDRTAFEQVPAGNIQNEVVEDQYEYHPSTLDVGRTRWTAKRAVEDVLTELEGTGGYTVDGFPIESDDNAGQFTLHNITLRDAGDVALGRVLSQVPGAEVFVATDGQVHVIDGTDLQAAEQHSKDVGEALRGGEVPGVIDRKHIRPSKVHVYYQREIEVLFEYEDNYEGTTFVPPGRNVPFIENVIPTVDPRTPVSDYDPETNTTVSKNVPPGVYVPIKEWLAYTNSVVQGSFPWTWETIRHEWNGNLAAALGATGSSEDITADVTPEGVTRGNMGERLAALTSSFRTLFRISRRFTERTRAIINVRAGLLDPVVGTRSPALVWGQATVWPSSKGRNVQARRNPNQGYIWQIDSLKESREDPSKKIIETRPSPAKVQIVDSDTGVFLVKWEKDPYGTVEKFNPCLTAQRGSSRYVIPAADLGQQDEKPVATGMHTDGFTNAVELHRRMELKALMTIIPSAPNNTKQFHRVTVEADDIADIFQSEYGIRDGQGPELHVFVPAGEATARFAWSDDQQCRATIAEVLGLTEDDPAQAGVDHDEPLAGYVIGNAEKELQGHARAVAAELLANFADNVGGRVLTGLPEAGVKLTGNMSSATLQVAAAQSATVRVVHEFPGQQKPISRMALLPEAVRHVVNGVLPVTSS